MARGSTTIHTLVLRTVTEGMPIFANSMNAVNTATTKTTTSLTNFNTTAKTTPPIMNGAAGSANTYTGALGNVTKSASAVSGPLSKANILAGQNAVAYQTASGSANTYSGATDKVQNSVLPLVSRIGGLAFAFAGLNAAAGEAAGMQEILSLSQDKVNELTALQAELVANNMTETDLYARVTNELEQAQRALVRQQTITNLSMQDQTFFLLAIASQAIPTVAKGMTGLIAKSKEMGGGFTGLATTIGGALSGGFVKLTEKLHIIPQKFTSAGVSANTFGTALKGLALNPFMIALTAITAFIGIFVTNMFGARDAINSFGVHLGNVMPIFKPLLVLLGQAGDALVTAFGGSINKVNVDTQKAIVTLADFRTSVRDIYAEVAATPDFALLPLLLEFDAALLKVHQTGTQNLPEVNKLLADLWTSNKAPSAAFNQQITDISLKILEFGKDSKFTTAEMAILAEMFKTAAAAADVENKALAETNKSMGLAADGTKFYSANVLAVSQAIEASGPVQDQYVKVLDDTQKAMFEVANKTGLSGDALKDYLANVEASSGATLVFGDNIVRLNDGSVDLIATINNLAAAETSHIEGAKASWNGLIGLIKTGEVTYQGAALAVEAIADQHDVAAEHYEKYAQGVIDGNIKVSAEERKLIDLLIEKGIISVDTEADTQTAIDETNKKIEEQIAELNLGTQAVGLNAEEKQALIDVTEIENKQYDEVNEKLRALAHARGADITLLDEENAILRLFVDTTAQAAVTTEEIANATTILRGEREEEAKATAIEEAALRNYIASMNQGINTTNLTAEGMNKIITAYDTMGNATRIATSDVEAWHVELKASHDVDVATMKSLEDLAGRYGKTIPDAIMAKGIPAIKDFIENMLGTVDAAIKMKEETTKAFNEMAQVGQDMIADLIDEAILEGDAKKIKKELKDIGLEADTLTQVQRIITVSLNDKGFEGDLKTLTDLQRTEFGKMQGFAVEDADKLIKMYSQELQDEFGNENPKIGDVANQVWEYVKQNAPAGATGDYLLAEYGKHMEDPSIVQKALDGSLITPAKEKTIEAGVEIENEATKIPPNVAAAIESGKGVIQNAAMVTFKDPTTGEIRQIPIEAGTELGPLEGVFNEKFLAAQVAATGQLNLIMASVVFTLRAIDKETKEKLETMTGYWTTHATNVETETTKISNESISPLDVHIGEFRDHLDEAFGFMDQKIKDFASNVGDHFDDIDDTIGKMDKKIDTFQKNTDKAFGTMDQKIATFAKNFVAEFKKIDKATGEIDQKFKTFQKNTDHAFGTMDQKVKAFVSNFVDGMDDLIQSVDDAISAIDDLVSAIEDIPEEKTVTIKQEFETSGEKHFAKGGSFMVNQLTHIGDKIVGEEGPEIVTVTPLSGSGAPDVLTAKVGLPQSIIGNVPMASSAGPGRAGGTAGSGGPININVSGNINAIIKTLSGKVLAEESMPYLLKGSHSLT